MSRIAAAALLAAALSILPAAAQNADAERLEAELTSDNTAGIGTAFTLTDPEGKARSLASFRGKVVLLYFGFTSCPDVCPTDLQQIARALRAVGKRASGVQVLFVTLDPERDTPRLLAQYTRAFDARILALRGSEAEVNRIARAFKIYAARAALPGGGYTIDHSAYTLLLDREGNFRDYMPPGTPSGRMAVMIDELLTATRKPVGDRIR